MSLVHDSAFSLEALQEAAQPYPSISQALNQLCSLYEVLVLYGIAGYVSFDLGMISPYTYYTGIVFAGYTYGSGEPVVKGGRYDNLLSYFGKKAPSIGFAIVIDRLMATLSRQKIAIPLEKKCRLLVYSEEKRAEAISAAESFRGDGEEVLLLSYAKEKSKEDYLAYGKRYGLQEITFME
jgi:ATP phosphoribosyltransferase regulatory subunit